jgi:hypothetical protein
MPIESTSTRIAYLVRRRFPDVLTLQGVSPRPRAPVPNGAQRLEEIAAYEAELKAKGWSELDRIYDLERTKDVQEQRDLEESRAFFNKPNAMADFEHWSKASYWTLDEALALSFAKAPEVVTWDKLRPTRQVFRLPAQYARIRDLALRAIEANQLSDPSLPGAFIAWAKRFDVPYPLELEAKVAERGGFIGDWKTLYDRLNAVFEQRVAAYDRLSAGYDQLQKQHQELWQASKKAKDERDEQLAHLGQERDAFHARGHRVAG